jgi:predicted phosphodiesterase
MRIICLSDTHNQHDQIAVPDGDFLIHAGDATLNGTTDETTSFMNWLSAQPHATKIFVPGNHDEPFAQRKELAILRKMFPKVRILIDQELRLRGMRIYGAPWLPAVFSDPTHWLGVRSPQLQKKWEAIPDDTALLVTHGPPCGILDKNEGGQYIGDPVLAYRLSQLADLRLHVFGHVHASIGTMEKNGRLSLNAAICDSKYRPTRKPAVIEWNDGAAKIN